MLVEEQNLEKDSIAWVPTWLVNSLYFSRSLLHYACEQSFFFWGVCVCVGGGGETCAPVFPTAHLLH